MSWRKNPKIEKLLEKATLETLLKVYFQRVYGKQEVQEMENSLKKVLEKYPNKERLYEKLYDENNEKDAEPYLNECLDRLCQKTLSRAGSHTPTTLLALAKLFVKIGDCRLACEVIWFSASLSIQDFIRLHGLKVSLNSHDAKTMFVQALSFQLRKKFYLFERCHSSFYTGIFDQEYLYFVLERLKEFIEQLQSFELTDTKRKELERNV